MASALDTATDGRFAAVQVTEDVHVPKVSSRSCALLCTPSSANTGWCGKTLFDALWSVRLVWDRGAVPDQQRPIPRGSLTVETAPEVPRGAPL